MTFYLHFTPSSRFAGLKKATAFFAREARDLPLHRGHKGGWPVAVMCDTLGVSPAGYYAWRERPPSCREQRRDALLGLIRGVHAEVKRRYGSPRIHAELRAGGVACCVNTVARLMRDNGIRARRRGSSAARRTPTTHCRWRTTSSAGSSSPAAQRALGDGHHLYPDAGGLAVPRGRRGPVLAEGRRLVDGRDHDQPPGGRCAGRWRWRGGCPARACWRTRTGAASTPATTTSGCWQARHRVQHERGGPSAGTTRRWRASSPA